MSEKKRLPAWLPPLVYGLLTLVLFREFVFSDAMLYGSDTLSLGYVAREFFADAVTEHGVFPRWNPYILGGTPFLEALSGGDTLYPTSILLFVMEPYRALGWKLVLHVFLAGLFMYGWIRVLGRSRGAAFLAGLAYMLAPFLVTLVNPGHDGKLFVTALTPLIFWAAESSLVRRDLLGYVGVAAAVAVVVLTTHYQMAYFLFGAVGIYYIFRCVQIWRAEKGRGTSEEEAERPSGRRGPTGLRAATTAFGLFLGASVLGAAVGGVQLIPSFNYVLEHSRRTATTVQARGAESVEYSSSWSLHPEEAVSVLAVPEFVGNNGGEARWAQDTYWGRNVFKDNLEYIGLVALLLAGLSFFGASRKGLRWFFVGLGSVALLYALGRHTPVWRLFYEVLPGVSLFRAPSIAVFLTGFSAVTLMAFGVDRGVELARDPDGEGWKRAHRYLWIAAGLLGFGAILASSGILLDVWTGVLYSEMGQRSRQALGQAEPFIVQGFWIATALAAALAATWWALAKDLLAVSGLLAVLAVLVAVDGFRVSDSFVRTISFQRWAAPDDNMQYLMERLEEGDRFRLLSLNQQAQDVKPAMYGIELVAGHHPNDLADYRELIGMRGSSWPTNLINPQEGYIGFKLLALLNTRYMVVPGGAIQGLRSVSQVRSPDGRVISTLHELQGTLPRAWLVGDVEVIADDVRAAERILEDDFDPSATAILPAEAPGPLELPGGSVEGSVRWTSDGLNEMALEVSSDRPALLVISENWFPAWHATVNGEEAPVLRADVSLRAVPVPPGSSRVVLSYRSGLVRASLGVSLGALVVLLGLGTFSYLKARRARGRGEG